MPTEEGTGIWCPSVVSYARQCPTECRLLEAVAVLASWASTVHTQAEGRHTEAVPHSHRCVFPSRAGPGGRSPRTCEARPRRWFPVAFSRWLDGTSFAGVPGHEFRPLRGRVRIDVWRSAMPRKSLVLGTTVLLGLIGSLPAGSTGLRPPDRPLPQVDTRSPAGAGQGEEIHLVAGPLSKRTSGRHPCRRGRTGSAPAGCRGVPQSATWRRCGSGARDTRHRSWAIRLSHNRAPDCRARRQ